MFNVSIIAKISDVVGKCGRISGVVILIFNISFQNVSYVIVKIVQ